MLVLSQRDELDAPESKERRRGLRIVQNRPVKVFDATTGRYYGGQTHDLSATGLRIELWGNAPVRCGKLISVHIGVNESGQPLANRRMMLPARVVWVDRSSASDNGHVCAGLELVANIAASKDAA